ncbi:MAG: nucleotidyltransferase domain-containing protein [Caldilineaceae bacterium]|nr:nucleotidyltransferase domain-containing protein [Caldilineaceae bacterium]MBP8106612.1 nucleotidyltransferase domain-containing protein [Caldilineaceae bacterium]MBP8121319.1 nucleotidyltransferase domain-containing protein [Caldilineaceae bacterium]MBP9070885.1 nucleotidyltransferase domain-containing protein [Caldilineaceae bacterium]
MGAFVESIPHTAISELCRRWNIRQLALFGSALGEDFTDSSDIDLLVMFNVQARPGLLDHIQIENELSEIFGRDVDLVSQRAVEGSHNWIRRRGILNSAQIIWTAEKNVNSKPVKIRY